ncbi:MAG TPA: hypothetical protein VFV19_16090 [Candidatus Polarisedimenticolaceae bacterium]|nr:hypothetical protein [Candidatus Polarisedimenticolaceae bacterium]
MTAFAAPVTKKLDRLFPVASCPFPRPDCAETSLICPDYCATNPATPLCTDANSNGACCEQPYGESSPEHCGLNVSHETSDLQFGVPAVGGNYGGPVAITIRRTGDTQPSAIREISYLAFIAQSPYLDNQPTQSRLDDYLGNGNYCAASDSSCDDCKRESPQDCYQGDGRPTVFFPVRSITSGEFGFEEPFNVAPDNSRPECYRSDSVGRRHGTWVLGGGASIAIDEFPSYPLRLGSSSDNTGATATLVVPFVPSGLYELYGIWFSSTNGQNAVTFEVATGDDERVFDEDGDGVPNECDNCPSVPNGDCDASTAACDINGDGILSADEISKGNQADTDGDGRGDACPDSTPPTSSASVTPDPNAAGWNNTDAVVTITAVDETGGSGVASISVETSGAQVVPLTVTPGASAMVTTSAEGTTNVKFWATDNAGNTEAPQTLPVMVDKSAPQVTCSVNPSFLWPPNHRLVDVVASVSVIDALSGPDNFVLDSVLGDEPDKSKNGVDIANDIQGFVLHTGDTTGKLRAECLGTGDGRTYKLIYHGLDHAGNSSQCEAIVVVPHDQRRGASGVH